ncbi:MAG TPA: hypothetical protein VL979_14275 [Solirubrobacteraceae bacterium]|nr:hypothetical protein [Solirubrobacteraceae bacterium]
MKRIRIVGLCLVAVFALTAVIASSAQAGTYYKCSSVKKGFYSNSECTTRDEKGGKPKGKWELTEYKTCVSVKKGFYSDSACSVRDEKKGKPKGKFEKEAPVTFTDSTGEAKLATPAFGPNDVECTASTSSGTITGPKTGTDRVSFTGCTLEGHSCESVDLFGNGTPSGKAGVIDTNLLDTKLVDHGEKAGGYKKEEPATGEVWNEVISSEHEPYSSEFICNGEIILRTHGSVSGVVSPVNAAPSTSGENKFAVGEGEQALLTEVFNGTEFFPTGGAPSSEETTAKITLGTALAVKT